MTPGYIATWDATVGLDRSLTDFLKIKDLHGFFEANCEQTPKATWFSLGDLQALDFQKNIAGVKI